MPIGYRSTGTGSTGAAATSITTTVPAGVADGDLLVWTLALNAGTLVAEPAVPAGWTRLTAFQVVGAGPSQGQITWFRWAHSEPANYVVSGLASGRYAAHMHAFTDVDSIAVEDVGETQASNASGETANPANTPVTPGAWILAEESDSAASGVTTTTYSSSNATQIGTVSSTSASTINAALGACYLDTWTSGAFTPNLLPTGTIARSVASTIVLRPAAAGVASRQVLFAPAKAPRLLRFQQQRGVAVAAEAQVNPDFVFAASQRRTFRGYPIRRAARVETVPAQAAIPPPPAFVPDRSRPRARMLVRSARRASGPFPQQTQPPPSPARRVVLRGLSSRRVRRTAVFPADYPPPSSFVRPRRAGWIRRVRRVEVVPAQVAVILPAYVPAASQRRTLRGWLSRRARRVEIVPPQVVVPPPAYVPTASQKRALRGWLARRGRRPEVVPPQQAAPVNPDLIHRATQRRAVRGWLGRRGRRPEIVPPQITPTIPILVPKAAGRRPSRTLARRLRAAVTPPAAQATVTLARPPAARTRLPWRRRPALPQPVPAQAAAPPPPKLVPQASQRRTLRGWLRSLRRIVWPVPPPTAPTVTHPGRMTTGHDRVGRIDTVDPAADMTTFNDRDARIEVTDQ